MSTYLISIIYNVYFMATTGTADVKKIKNKKYNITCNLYPNTKIR